MIGQEKYDERLSHDAQELADAKKRCEEEESRTLLHEATAEPEPQGVFAAATRRKGKQIKNQRRERLAELQRDVEVRSEKMKMRQQLPDLRISPSRMSVMMISVMLQSNDVLFNESVEGDHTWIRGLGPNTPYGILGMYFSKRSAALYPLKRDNVEPQCFALAVNNAHVLVRNERFVSPLTKLLTRFSSVLDVVPPHALRDYPGLLSNLRTEGIVRFGTVHSSLP